MGSKNAKTGKTPKEMEKENEELRREIKTIKKTADEEEKRRMKELEEMFLKFYRWFTDMKRTTSAVRVNSKATKTGKAHDSRMKFAMEKVPCGTLWFLRFLM